MSVAELIAKLREMPQDMMVCVPSPEGFDPETVTDVEVQQISVRHVNNAIGRPYSSSDFIRQDAVVLRQW